MGRLVVRVTGVPKWVRIEDQSGPEIKHDGMLAEGDPDVEVTIIDPGDGASVIVDAGRHRNTATSRYRDSNMGPHCLLVLDDRRVPPTGYRDDLLTCGAAGAAKKSAAKPAAKGGSAKASPAARAE